MSQGRKSFVKSVQRSLIYLTMTLPNHFIKSSCRKYSHSSKVFLQTLLWVNFLFYKLRDFVIHTVPFFSPIHQISGLCFEGRFHNLQIHWVIRAHIFLICEPVFKIHINQVFNRNGFELCCQSAILNIHSQMYFYINSFTSKLLIMTS